jgi:hypothetical protein
MTTQELPRYLLPQDVRDMLAGLVSIRTIQRLAEKGEIPGARKIGRRWFFQRVPVVQWVEGGNAATIIDIESRRRA